MEDLKIEKEKFLKWQFFILTISASFSRGNIYKEGVKEEQKVNFKKTLFFALNGIAESKYAFESAENLISSMRKIQHQSMNYEHILQGGKLRFGTCQKLVNLYLKYLWCANLIQYTPLHFPLDRLIQKRTKKVSWTKLDDAGEYSQKINEIHPQQDKSEWELKEYNKQFY